MLTTKFLTILRNHSKNCPKATQTFPNIFRTCRQMTEDCWRPLKKIRRRFDRISTSHHHVHHYLSMGRVMLHCIGPLLTAFHRRWAHQRWWKHAFMQVTGRQGLKTWIYYGSLDPPCKVGSNMQRSGTCPHPQFCPYPLWHEYLRRFKEGVWIKTCFHPCTLPKHGCPRLKETG